MTVILVCRCLCVMRGVGSRPSDHYFRSVCLSVCLCRVFLSRLRSDLDQTRTHVTCPGLVVSLEYRGCATRGGWVTPKNLYFRGFGAAVNHYSVAASSSSFLDNVYSRLPFIRDRLAMSLD